MHIDYKNLLPTSPTCDHLSVSWETTTADVPEGTPDAHSITVTVTCQGCPATTTKTLYYVRTRQN